jgi:transposase-like protein
LTLDDVAELQAERGVHILPSTVHAWVQKFAQLYEAAAHGFRRELGARWSVDETDVKIAGQWRHAYCAIDDLGQAVDVYVSEQRAAEDAAAFFRRAIERTDRTPTVVTINWAATYSLALAEALAEAEHQAGKRVQQLIERDHGRLKRRLASTLGLKTLAGARALCRGHALVRHLGGGHDRPGLVASDPGVPREPLIAR